CGECAHEQPIPRLAQRVRRYESASDSLGFVRTVAIDLRLTDRLKRLSLGVPERAAFRLDPCSILARQEAAGGDLVRDHGLGPCIDGVSLAAEGRNLDK